MGVISILTVVFISVVVTFLSEGISYVLIYRTENYKRLKSVIDKTQKKLDSLKEQGSIEKKAQRQKDRLDADLQQAQKDMMSVRMKSTFITGILMVSVFTFVGTMFEGEVVGRLPFEPFSLIRGISHRNLRGEDFYDCSATFIYVLCSISLRDMITKYLGFTPKNQGGFASMFPTMPDAK